METPPRVSVSVPVPVPGPVPAPPRRVPELVDLLERSVLSRKVRDVRVHLSELCVELRARPWQSVEQGALSGVLGALNYVWKDGGVAEVAFGALAGVPRRMQGLGLAQILHADGVELVVKVAREHRGNARVVAFSVVVCKSFCGDEAGVRLLVAAGGVAWLGEVLRSHVADRALGLSCVSTLVTALTLSLNARTAFLDLPGGLCEVLMAFARRHHSVRDAEVAEAVLSLLCLVSTGRIGCMAVLNVLPTVPPPTVQDRLWYSDFSEAGCLALEVLAQHRKAVAASSSSSPSPPPPPGTPQQQPPQPQSLTTPGPAPSQMDVPSALVDVLKGAGTALLDRVATGVRGTPTPSKDGMGGGGGVVVARERRAHAWAFMLLYNLWYYGEQGLKQDLLRSLQSGIDTLSDTTTAARDLERRILMRMKADVVGSSPRSTLTLGAAAAGSPPSHSPQQPPTSTAFEESQEERVIVEYMCGDQDGGGALDGETPILATLFNVGFLETAYDVSLPRLVAAVKNVIARALAPDFEDGPLPASRSVSRAIMFLHVLLAHPWLRTRALAHPDVVDTITSVVQALKAGDPPEYFGPVGRALESALNMSTTPISSEQPSTPSGSSTPHVFLPQRRFAVEKLDEQSRGPDTPSALPGGQSTPAKTPGVTSSTSNSEDPFATDDVQLLLPHDAANGHESSSSSSNNNNNFDLPPAAPQDDRLDLRLWKSNPRELVRQLTLRMEKLSFACDPCEVVVTGAFQQAPGSSSYSTSLSRVLDYHNGLFWYFQEQILSRPTPSERAEILACVIEIASAAAASHVSNVDLTMACLRALDAPAVQRLENSWRLCPAKDFEVLQQLKSLARFPTWGESEDDDQVPSLLTRPALPYTRGCLAHLSRSLASCTGATLPVIVEKQYRVLTTWFPHVGRSGDWHPRPHAFQHLPMVQVMVSKPLCSPDAIADPAAYQTQLLEHSRATETPFDVERGFLRALSEVECIVEDVLESIPSLVKAVIQARVATSVRELGTRVGALVEDVCQEEGAARQRMALEVGVLTRWGDVKRHVHVVVERVVLGPVMGRLRAKFRVGEVEDELANRLRALRDLPTWEQRASALGVTEARWRTALPGVMTLMSSLPSHTPTEQLAVLLLIKDEIFRHGANMRTSMSADDFLPVLALCVVESSMPDPWSSLTFLKDFFGEDALSSGEAAYYVVSLESVMMMVRRWAA